MVLTWSSGFRQFAGLVIVPGSDLCVAMVNNFVENEIALYAAPVYPCFRIKSTSSWIGVRRPPLAPERPRSILQVGAAVTVPVLGG